LRDGTMQQRITFGFPPPLIASLVAVLTAPKLLVLAWVGWTYPDVRWFGLLVPVAQWLLNVLLITLLGTLLRIPRRDRARGDQIRLDLSLALVRGHRCALPFPLGISVSRNFS